MKSFAQDTRWSSQVGRFKTLFKWILVVVIVSTLIQSVFGLLGSYRLSALIPTTAFSFAIALAVLYRLVNPIAWKFVLASAGHRMSGVRCIQLWLIAESKRWLPGGVWGYASRAMACKREGISMTAASASIFLELLLTILAATVLTCLGLGLYWEQFASPVQNVLANCQLALSHLFLAFAGATGIAVVAYWKRNAIIDKWLQFNSKFALIHRNGVQPKALVQATAYLVAMAFLNGWINSELVCLVAESNSVPLIAMVAATAAAWVLGLVAFFSPGGLLVREAALATLLLPWLDYEAGLVLATLSRLAQIAAELVCLIPALWPDSKTRSNKNSMATPKIETVA